MRREVLKREYVERRYDLRTLLITAVAEQIEKGVHQLRKRFGLLVPVDYHQQWALSRVPQQNQIQGLRRCGQAGERQRSRVLPRKTAHQFLKRRMTREALE